MATRNGTAARIRAILEREEKATSVEIALELGIPTRKVSNAMQGMAGVYRHRGNNHAVTVYSLQPIFKPPVKRAENVAPKHYHNWQTPEMTRESYDIYASRDLAMLAR